MVKKKKKVTIKLKENPLEIYCHLIYKFIGRNALKNKKFKNFFYNRFYNKKYESIELLISNEDVVYMFNSTNLSLEALEYYSGNILKTYNLIWQPESIVVDKKYLGCLNDRKLYFLNL